MTVPAQPTTEPTTEAASEPAERTTPGGRVPDFFLVGTPKCGTTALYHMLRAHPQIYMPELKEPLFLASEMRPRAGFADEPRELVYPQTLEDYLALFAEARPEQRVGEASTNYLWSPTAAARIAELQPDARIIAILREPASFLRSLHLMLRAWRNETEKDLRRAMSLEPARRAGKQIPRGSHRPQLLQYSEHVRYVEQLRRYRDRFPAEQVLVLIYDDYRDDNEATVRRVLRFLGVDDRRPVELVNARVRKQMVRSWKVKKLLRSVSMGDDPISRAAKATTKTLTTRRLRRGAMTTINRRVALRNPPPPDEGFMLELRRRFKGEVVALSEYLERDLVSLWGYDELD